MMKKIKLLFLSLLFVGFLAPHTANAQAQKWNTGDLILGVIPIQPGMFEGGEWAPAVDYRLLASGNLDHIQLKATFDVNGTSALASLIPETGEVPIVIDVVYVMFAGYIPAIYAHDVPGTIDSDGMVTVVVNTWQSVAD